MTGLESVSDREEVKKFLSENQLKPGGLMADWPGWDTPHLCDMKNGGIVPTSVEMLLEDAEWWAHTGKRPRQLCASRMVSCPRCRRMILWVPAPDQRENEDSIGPMLRIPDIYRGAARLSPPDVAGKTHLLVRRRPGQDPSYWPAELNCKSCVTEGRRAAALWNDFMGREPVET